MSFTMNQFDAFVVNSAAVKTVIGGAMSVLLLAAPALAFASAADATGRYTHNYAHDHQPGKIGAERYMHRQKQGQTMPAATAKVIMTQPK